MAKYTMKADELASMEKGQLTSKKIISIPGIDEPELNLTEEDIQWWRDAKFGLFIHWGIYALIGKGEWAYFNEKIPEKAYRNIAENEFMPELNAEEIAKSWIDAAKDAGMKYAVMVTRHHDGFALWDSKHSWKQFTSACMGSKTDYVEAFTKECHKNELRVGLYYSPMDWRFPAYFDPEGMPENAQMMKEQAYKQLEELCTEYGKVDIIWYDGGWLSHEGSDADAAWLWEPIKLNKMLRSYQPKVMFSPRSGYKGDFICDEGPHEVNGGIIPYPWEKCMSISTAWGYIPNDKYLSVDYLITMLINVICRDGNLLLNVGPDPNGRIPEEVSEILNGMGRWLKENGESVYGTKAGIWEPVDMIYGSVCKGDTVYLHVLDCKAFKDVILSPVDKVVKNICLLEGIDIEYSQNETGIRICIPEWVTVEKRVDTILKISL